MSIKRLNISCIVAISVASIFLTACATTAEENDVVQGAQNSPKSITNELDWVLRLPEEEKVIFKGVVSIDGAGGGTQSMLYPAPNAIGFVAAVITHAVINQTVRSGQKTKLQEDADKVLLPYQPVLTTYTHKELMQKGLEKALTGGKRTLIGFSEKASADWSLETTPVFSMTQDQSTLILENFISIYAPGTRSAARHQATVRVVSESRSGADLVSFWTMDNGRKLKEESAVLFAESIDIAISNAMNAEKMNSNTHKTFRYSVGKTENMERGQLVNEHCGRIVIKTLRGEIMSFPARREEANTTGTGKCERVSSNVK